MKLRSISFLPSLTVMLLILLISSCEDSNDVHEYKAQIVEAELPETAMKDVPVKFIIRFGTTNGCQYYSRQKTVTKGMTIEVSIYAAYKSASVACAQVAMPIPVEYTFLPKKSGTYMFKFASGDGHITDTIVVN